MLSQKPGKTPEPKQAGEAGTKLTQRDERLGHMKSQGSSTGEFRQSVSKQDDNAAWWARQAVANHACQDAVDTKAFTGRGKLHELRHLLANLEEVEVRMKTLSAASKEVTDARMYLMVHRRSTSGYTFLRWRERLGTNRHLSWEEADIRIAEHPPVQRRWCTEANELAKALNSEHLTHRERIKALRTQLSRSPSHLFPRPLPAKAD